MKATTADPKSGHDPHAHPARKGSPVRLIILLSILIVIGGALVYDWGIAPPQVKAANDKLHDTVLKHNELGVIGAKKKAADQAAAGIVSIGEPGGLIYSKDVQKILGMKPSRTETTERYTIEYYRWWGWIPRNRNYITVLYVGDNPDKRHYSTHYANMLPEDAALPGKLKEGPPVVDLTSGTNSENVAIPSAPPGMGPGMVPPADPGAGAGKKGKGRPQGKADKAEAGKDNEGDKSQNAAEPKPDVEPRKEEAAEEKPEANKDAAAPPKADAKDDK
jgi:hypothetical protein